MDEITHSAERTATPVAVVHVSGPLGCGKTCFAADMRKLFEAGGHVRVVNTDDLITPGSAVARELDDFETDRLDFVEERYVAHWSKVFGGLIRAEVESALEAQPPLKVLLLVGCFDHYAPRGTMPIELKEATHRFVIKRHITHLLSMYFSRFRAEFIDDDTFWEDVYNGVTYIPSSEEYIESAIAITEWHLSNGYAACTPEEIRAVIEELVNK
jgi:hypothetical protein